MLNVTELTCVAKDGTDKRVFKEFKEFPKSHFYVKIDFLIYIQCIVILVIYAYSLLKNYRDAKSNSPKYNPPSKEFLERGIQSTSKWQNARKLFYWKVVSDFQIWIKFRTLFEGLPHYEIKQKRILSKLMLSLFY